MPDCRLSMRCDVSVTAHSLTSQDVYWRLLEKISGSKLKLTKSVGSCATAADVADTTPLCSRRSEQTSPSTSRRTTRRCARSTRSG